jgi:hypothetical protein
MLGGEGNECSGRVGGSVGKGREGKRWEWDGRGGKLTHIVRFIE